MTHDTPLLRVTGLGKGFTMHLQNQIRLPVIDHVGFEVHRGECVVLGGPSGAGKSSILKMVYGNYLAETGSIKIMHRGEAVELVNANPRTILNIRQRTVGYVSQFLSVIPRISALELVAEISRDWGADDTKAAIEAGEMLAKLNIPERLWSLPPATFSGGEQQRVNIARGFMGQHELLLLDEPTASLDATNQAVVLDMIAHKKAAKTGMLGIFHDQQTRNAVADRVIDVTEFAAVA